MGELKQRRREEASTREEGLPRTEEICGSLCTICHQVGGMDKKQGEETMRDKFMSRRTEEGRKDKVTT